MVSVRLTIKDDGKAADVIRFLRDIDFLEVHVQQEKPRHQALEKAFGIWQGRDVSLAEIRKKAWRQP